MKSKMVQWTLIGLVPAALALFALFLSSIRSTFDIPRDDDWSYLNVTFEWAKGGRLVLNGWVHMMFVSQGALGASFTSLLGPRVWVLQLLVLIVGVGGLVSLYLLSRVLLPQGLSLLVVTFAGLSPLWLRLSVSFMTDIPAWSLAGLSFAFGIVACKELSRSWLLLAAVLGLLAFGIREYALVPLVVLLVWLLLGTFPKYLRRWALILLVGVVLCAVCSFLWRQTLPGSIETSPSSLYEAMRLASSLALTCALLLTPYLLASLVLLWPQKHKIIRSLKKFWVGSFLGFLLGLGCVASSSLRLTGNVIHPYGSSWTSAGDGVRALPLWGFRAMTLLAVVSLLVLLACTGMILQKWLATSRPGNLDAQPRFCGNFASLYVLTSAVLIGLYFMAIFVVGAPAFDRYLLLAAPLLGIVILWTAARNMHQKSSAWQAGAIAAIIVVTGSFGVVITDSLNQVDGLRWQVASSLVEGGVAPQKIDGGDVWFRFHQMDAPGVAKVGSLDNAIPGRTWWQTFFQGSTFCRMVAIESETDLQARYGPAVLIQEERTLLGTPFRIMVFTGPDPC